LKKLLAIVLAVVLIAAIAIPIASANITTLVALNPLGDIEIQQNIPLTSRERFQDADGNPDFYDRVIGLSWYTKTNNPQMMQAFGELLVARLPGVVVVNVTPLGSPWHEKSDANYNLWAGLTDVPGLGRPLDAVIFGVAD